MTSRNGRARFCGNCTVAGDFCGDVPLSREGPATLKQSSTTHPEHHSIIRFVDKAGGQSSEIDLGDEFPLLDLEQDEIDVVGNTLQDTVVQRVEDCERGVANPQPLGACPAVSPQVLAGVILKTWHDLGYEPVADEG